MANQINVYEAGPESCNLTVGHVAVHYIEDSNRTMFGPNSACHAISKIAHSHNPFYNFTQSRRFKGQKTLNVAVLHEITKDVYGLSRPSQSQNGRRASQNQSQGTRSRRPREEEYEEDDDDQPEDHDNEDEDVDMEEETSGNDLQRKAAALVRLALFTEQRRTSLKRDEISKKALGGNGRSFKEVFELAQEILRKTFGMELVELQLRDPDAEDDVDNRAATGVKKKAANPNTRSYILRSTLHPLLLEHAALTDEQLLDKELQESKEADGTDDDDIDWTPSSYGSIINWAQSDNLGAIGVLYTLLAIILVNSRVVSDIELRAHLKRLGLPAVAGQISFPEHSTVPIVSVETYLTTLLKQNYLERVPVGGDPAGSAKGKGKGKRGRVNLGGEEDGDGMSSGGSAWEWRWGSRAHSEVGEKGVAQWISEFMVGEDNEDDDEAEGRRAGNRNKRLEKMLSGVDRAAGGSLSDLW